MKLGPIELKIYGSKGTETLEIDLSSIPALFHKIPGASDILDDVFQNGLNRYQIYDRMVKRDSSLNTAINKLAMLVERCYKGIVMHPGEEMSEDEDRVLKLAQDEAKRLKFKRIFYAAARKMLIDGDVLIRKRKFMGKTRLDFLPMRKMTGLNKLSHLNLTSLNDDEIFSGPINHYIYAEGDVGTQRYRAQNVIQMGISSEAEEVKDTTERITWGMWSHSPLESLRPEVYWKLASIVNDMIWRRLYLPREHHEIDLSDMLDLSKYEGDTIDVRRTNALAAVSNAIDAYIVTLKGQMPDQGYVTAKVGEVSAVKITVIEPKSTTYVSPNELLNQLAGNIASAYFVRLTNESSASFAAEHIIASDTQVAAEFLAGIIKDELLEVLKDAISGSLSVMMEEQSEEEVPEPSSEETFLDHLDKLDIRLQLILPKDMENLVRMSAVLRSAKVVLVDEIRTLYLGLDPLTTEQREQLDEEAMKSPGGFAQTMDQVTRDFTSRKDDEEQGENKREKTPESKKANQKT